MHRLTTRQWCSRHSAVLLAETRCLHGILVSYQRRCSNPMIDDLSRRLYQSFQEWRIRVLGVITELDRMHLELLATDLRATLSRIEQELQARRTRTRDRKQ